MAKRKTTKTARKTAKRPKACCISRGQLCDTDDGLERVDAVLDELRQHESNASIRDEDRVRVVAVRLALLDAAITEVEYLRDEIKDAV